jgi:integrase
MLTDRAIKALKAPAKGQVDVSDGTDAKGLVLRVSQRSKVFYLSYRSPATHKAAKIRLGEYPALGLAAAREKGRAYRSLLNRGIDPRAHEKAEAEQREVAVAKAESASRNTLARAIPEFVAYCERAGQRRWRERERHLRVYLPVEWRARIIGDITRGEVRELLSTLETERGPAQANRVVQTLRTLYNWAIRDGRCAVNPTSGIRSAVREVSRNRVLSDVELAAIWRASVKLGEPFGSCIRLLILCGQRRSETARARWQDFDLDDASWEIPASESKQGRPHGVPLSAHAVTLVRALPCHSIEPAAFVFSTTHGERPISGWSKVKRRLDASLDIETPPWTLHDLRRTVASGMARLGIAPHVCEKVLGHESGVISGIAAVYNRHDYGDEKRRALEAWADHVAAVTSPGGKVALLARHRP